jgi:hypothetical protein
MPRYVFHRRVADGQVRQFLCSINGCFAQALQDMVQREMSCIQALLG